MFKALFVKENFIKYLSILVLPAAATGPFLPDVFVSVVALLFLIKSFKEKIFKYYKTIYFKIMLIMWIYITLLSFFSEYILISFVPSFFYIRFVIFSVVILYLLENSDDFINKLFITLFLFLSFIVIHALLIYFFNIDIFLFDFKNFKVNHLYEIISCPKEVGCGAVDFRISGIFYSELVLGSYLLRVCPVFLITFFVTLSTKKNNSLIIPSIILLLLSFFVIFISGERSAIGLSIIFIIMFLLLSTEIKKKKIILVILLILPILTLLSNPNVQNRILKDTSRLMTEPKQIYSSDDVTVFNKHKFNLFSKGHEGHFTSAFKIFVNNKFGVGVKMFRYECKRSEYQNIQYGCTTHPHNTYFNLLAETGLVGFVIIFGFFLYISKNILGLFFKKIYSKLKIYSPYTLSILIIFINLFPFVPSGAFFNNWLSILYFFPVGFYLYYHNNDNKFTS